MEEAPQFLRRPAILVMGGSIAALLQGLDMRL
jgi:hypothetical protein